MKFVLAEKNEADSILELYSSVIGAPFCTWNEYYPARENVDADIEARNLFVLKDGDELIGAISIVNENELDELDGWQKYDKAGEFARVAIRRDRQGQGLSRLLVEGAINELHGRGLSSVHILVAKHNIPAQRLYKSFGFEIRGEQFMYGNWYFMYELI